MLLCCSLLCSSWRPAAAFTLDGICGRSPPCARRLPRASLPITLPLLIASLLHALSPLVPLLSPALLPAELLHLIRLGTWAPLRRLCNRSWALRRLSVCRSRWLPCPVSCLSMLLCSLLLCFAWEPVVSYALTRYAPCATARGRFVVLRSALLIAPRSVRYLPSLLWCPLLRCSRVSDVAYGWARGRPSVHCAIARGLFAAYRSSALGRSPPSSTFFLGCYDASCFAARAAPLLRMPWYAGAPPPLGASARGRFAAFCLAAPVVPLCAVLRGCYAPCSSSARGAPLRPLPGPTGAPPPFVQLRVRAVLPFAAPLSVALFFCALSSAVTVPTPALLLPRLRCRLCSWSLCYRLFLLLVGLRYYLCLGPWTLLRPLCDCSWALYCL